MKKFLAAATVSAAVLTGSALPSMAAPTVPAVSLIDGSFSGTSPTAVSPLYDLFSFTIPIFGSRTVKAVASATNPDVTFTAFNFLSKSLQVLETGSIGSFGDNSLAALGRITLDPGQYFIGVRATGGNNTANTGYSGTLSAVRVSQVPLPSTVALFGVALAGLGVAGSLRKKVTSTKASA